MVVAATVAACALAATTFVGLGYQRYSEVRTDAQSSMESAEAAANSQVASFGEQQAALELALSNADQVLVASAGVTLDQKARDALKTAMARARTVLTEQTQLNTQLQQVTEATQRTYRADLVWPPTVLIAAQNLNARVGTSSRTLDLAVVAIGKSIGAVQDAQSAWQTEQDRVAAEQAAAEAVAAAEAAAQAAARLAAPRTIAPVSTITESGGSTAPSAPAPPSAPVAAVAGFNVEAYVLALAPNSYIEWVPALCSGYYVCGRAWVGGVNATPVRIELDPALRDIYANAVGISVLVHESAHARQWFYYGPEIITQNELLTGLTGAPAVEYMADCATIGKLGYSTGTYTSSCTADQLTAAALIW
jgi:hypothetical protein